MSAEKKSPAQRQDAISILYTLQHQHESTLKHYREIEETLPEGELGEWIGKLIQFHEKRAQEMRARIESLPDGIPVKPSNQSKHVLQEKESELVKALNQHNESRIASLIHLTEESVNAQYARALKVEQVPEDLKKELDKAQSALMENVRQAQRKRTVTP